MCSFIANAAWTVRYQHTDTLGSVIAESNSQGTITQRFDYKPFGEGTPTQKAGVGYTGHLEDTDLGLTYMQQRYYDPVIGRFYSNDPVDMLGHMQKGNPTMGFNRYAYANNNPYKYVDPDGQLAVQLFALIAGGIIGGAAEYMSNPNAPMGDILIAAGAGAASGLATSIPGMGLGMTMLAGAGANGAAEAGKQLATTGIDKKGAVKIATAVATGAVGGAVGKALGGAAQIISGAKGLPNNTMTQAANNMTESSSQRVLAGSAALATGVNTMKEAAVGAAYGAGSNLGVAAGEKFIKEQKQN